MQLADRQRLFTLVGIKEELSNKKMLVKSKYCVSSSGIFFDGCFNVARSNTIHGPY